MGEWKTGPVEPGDYRLVYPEQPPLWKILNDRYGGGSAGESNWGRFREDLSQIESTGGRFTGGALEVPGSTASGHYGIIEGGGESKYTKDNSPFQTFINRYENFFKDSSIAKRTSVYGAMNPDRNQIPLERPTPNLRVMAGRKEQNVN